MQTSFTQDPVQGMAGQVSSGTHSDIATRYAEGACPVGLGLVAGTSGALQQAKTPTSTVAPTAVTFLGVAHLDSSREVADYADGEVMGVVRKGRVWVAYEPDTVPTPDTQAYIRHTANGAGKLVLGAFRANADTSNASAVPGGYFRRLDTAAGLVELELN